jgi:hypothetical protein
MVQSLQMRCHYERYKSIVLPNENGNYVRLFKFLATVLAVKVTMVTSIILTCFDVTKCKLQFHTDKMYREL